MNYHESRDKLEEENDDKEKEEDDEKSKEEEQEEKDGKEQIKSQELKMKDKPKTILKKKKAKEEKIEFEDDDEEAEEEKPKITSKTNKPKAKLKKEEDNTQINNKVEFNEINQEETQTKLRSKKKNKLKTTEGSSNQKPKANIGSKQKNPTLKQPKNTITKPTTTIKVSRGVKAGPKSTVTKPITDRPDQSNQNKINKTGIFTNPKLNSTTTVKSTRKGSAEKRSNTKSGNKTFVNNSVGKRPVKKNIHNFTLDEEKVVEQSPEFKKILNKNRVEKAKSENEKAACLAYIINDYFKLKEIDAYFKNIIEQNPIFQPLSAKIYANLKNPKEFLLKKLNGACKYISLGDKNGFYNFMKVKDKNGKSNFEAFKSSFNSLLKSGPLKDLNENEVSNFCKSLLEMPELSFQTSKSLLKLCE